MQGECLYASEEKCLMLIYIRIYKDTQACNVMDVISQITTEKRRNSKILRIFIVHQQGIEQETINVSLIELSVISLLVSLSLFSPSVYVCSSRSLSLVFYD